MFEGLDGIDKANALYLAILLIVVLAGSLSLRGAGIGRLAKMAAAWIAIFAVILVFAAYRDEVSTVFSRTVAEVDPARGTTESGEFRLRARSDGHFWVRGAIDGEPVLFLIDTGATGIVLTREAARRVGVDPARLTFDRVARTANGPVRGASVRVGTLEIGPIVRSGVTVDVTEGALDTNLLGMSFLRTLSAWRVEGETLIMRP